jgi:hypothetical protein
MRYLTLSVLASAVLTGAAFAGDLATDSSASANDRPDAILDLSGSNVAAGIGYLWGSGDLTYLGTQHAFKLSGVSVVDVGAAHLNASGVVYNLKNLSDFNGTYTAVSVGLTVAGGGSAAILRNEHGVVIKLHATTRGLNFNFSADGVNIKLARA